PCHSALLVTRSVRTPVAPGFAAGARQRNAACRKRQPVYCAGNNVVAARQATKNDGLPHGPKSDRQRHEPSLRRELTIRSGGWGWKPMNWLGKQAVTGSR